MKKNLTALGCAILGLAIFSMATTAEARPNYFAAFKKAHPKAKAAAAKKCGVCHPEKSKKVKNDYGKAFGTELGAKKVKDAKKIKEALEKAAKKDSGTKGKTFGDLLDDDKLPGSKRKES